MDLGLTGRTALVTGGSRGIGYAIAAELAAEGASVEICARDDEAGQRAAQRLGASVAWTRADVCDEESVRALIEALIARHGQLDIVVNNAGRFGGGPLADLTGEALGSGTDTKVVGAARVVRHAAPHLRSSDQARVVNISGVSALKVIPGAAPTAVGNAGLLALTAYLARELRADDICVTCVVPGYTLSEVWRDRVAKVAQEQSLSFDDAMVAVLRGQGLDHARWGSPEEVAHVVTFLASKAAAFVSGTAIRVDGGQLAVTDYA